MKQSLCKTVVFTPDLSRDEVGYKLANIFKSFSDIKEVVRADPSLSIDSVKIDVVIDITQDLSVYREALDTNFWVSVATGAYKSSN